MAATPKLDHLSDRVRQAVKNDSYRISKHAQQRMEERDISLTEVNYILKNGYHEAAKDEFDNDRSNWRYSIRGMTVDRRDIRVVVSFDKITKMFVITVIDKDN